MAVEPLSKYESQLVRLRKKPHTTFIYVHHFFECAVSVRECRQYPYTCMCRLFGEKHFQLAFRMKRACVLKSFILISAAVRCLRYKQKLRIQIFSAYSHQNHESRITITSKKFELVLKSFVLWFVVLAYSLGTSIQETRSSYE